MIIFDYKKKILKFIICINVVLLVLFAIKKLLYNDYQYKDDNGFSTSIIKNDTDTTNIYVEYPRFNNEDIINKLITDSIYNYIREFKNTEIKKSLYITYDTYFINEYVNITFYIKNTLSNIKNKNILINLKNKQIAHISSLYDKNYLENEINKLVYNNYQTDIYNKIIKENVDNFTYIISDDNIEVYFNNISFDNIEFIPYVTINLNENISHINSPNEKKYIAFTFDDGPSNNSLNILNVLEKNNSSATFFVIGNNIKGKEDVIKKLDNSNSEIASHGYTHSNFTKLSKKELINEINSTNILLKSITNNNIKYIRPPYGEYNKELLNLGYKVILWNIDSKDWLVRNETKIYNNVIKNACDGCIVLMHDSYNETLNVTEKIIKELNRLGYSVVSVSKLIEIKNYDINKNQIISYIK